MTDRTRIILIFVGIAAVAGGAGFWFFKIHTPNQQREAAQEEIAGWDERWLAARTCLLGATPASSKVSEALAVRELSPDPWERKLCTAHISKLSRGEAEDTGLPEVEEAWRVLDKAAGKVAMSFASHVDPGGDGARRKPDPLPIALDELEAAYTALRASTGLAPLPAPAGTAPLSPATLVPVELAGKRVLSLQEPYRTSRAGLLAFGAVDGRELQLQLTAGKPPVVHAVGAGTQRAIPDGTWGAQALPDVIEIGALDDAGVVQAPTRLALPGATQVIAVIGTLADGVVVYGAGNQLVVARGKAGVFTPGKPLDVRSMAFATDAATGDTVIAWTDTTEQTAWLRLGADQLDAQPAPLGAPGYVQQVCLARDAAFIQTMGAGSLQLFAAGLTAGAIGAGDAEHHTLLGCSGEGALVTMEGDEATYQRCVAGKPCEAVTPGTQRDRAPLALLPAGVVGFDTRGSVLAVRRSFGPAGYFTVPNGFVAITAMTDGATLDVLGWSADGLVIARLPAK